ncbi:Fis family transcriptional regulator [Curtobacterium flaccumfaciens]|uniref:Fis family transcriptional regulator n=1 Tax=Curtobacterium flaccumfaciens TaxID=2035 RepID=UPI0021C6D1EF|nr:Fis family transcriptional regulator [Curtobacterium flaccumfaciens]UXN21169.1 Fis family transcriptional regulator [Curtobacterium flaccumfaciens pv. flaccumfaciens]
MTGAHFDESGSQVAIEGLMIDDPGVVGEARHWVGGERGQRCDDPAVLADADLTKFATEALVLGAKALSLTAQATEMRALERMLKDVGDKTAEATHRAGEATAVATRSATETVVKAAADAKKAITEVDETTRKHLAEAVTATKRDLLTETRRLFGGENPELLERLQPVLDKFAVTLEKQVHVSTSELLAKATKQLDPSDPTSPMAKHTATLAQQQEQFTKQIEKGQAELAAKVDDLSTALKVQDAKASIAKVTPIKGISFEDQVHALMSDIAVGLGDEYEDTTTKTGLVPRSKKGDGVLTVAGASARVVIEVTDSARANWGEYFDEAERNRAASASLGLVRSTDQNGGHSIRVLGQRRVVIAFDPNSDDTEVLRTVALLLRTVAIAAAARTGEAEVGTAEEKIGEAVAHLEKIDSIKKTAGSIQKGAAKIESECTSITTAIRRLLDQALVALAGHEATPSPVGQISIEAVA